jgi:hypothetical protein
MVAVRRLTRPVDAACVAAQTPLPPSTSLPFLLRLLQPVARLGAALGRGGDDNTVVAGTLARTAAQVGPKIPKQGVVLGPPPRGACPRPWAHYLTGVPRVNAQVFVHPIDTIKTRLQVRPPSPGGRRWSQSLCQPVVGNAGGVAPTLTPRLMLPTPRLSRYLSRPRSCESGAKSWPSGKTKSSSPSAATDAR